MRGEHAQFGVNLQLRQRGAMCFLRRTSLFVFGCGCLAGSALADITDKEAVCFVDFSHPPPTLALRGRAQLITTAVGQVRAFQSHIDTAELPWDPHFEGVTAMSAGGWFYSARAAEQYFFSR